MADSEIVWNDAALESLPLRPEVAATIDRIAAGTLQTMKVLTPVSPVGFAHRSGNLRSSEHAFRQANGDIVIGPTADYGRFVNDGTRPHLIESHGPWSLHNVETGQFFGRVVHHPGTVGSHFIERTAATLDGRVFHA